MDRLFAARRRGNAFYDDLAEKRIDPLQKGWRRLVDRPDTQERNHNQANQTRHSDIAHPLSPVSVIPWTKLFCAMKKIRMTGKTIIVEAAMSSPHSER